MDRLEVRLEGREDIFVGVPEESVCELTITLRPNRLRKSDLLRHQLDFPAEVREIRSSAVRAEERNGVDAVPARANVTDEVTQQIFPPRDWSRATVFLDVHAHRDEATSRCAPVEVPRQASEPSADIPLDRPCHFLLDRDEIFPGDELLVRRHVAAVGA